MLAEGVAVVVAKRDEVERDMAAEAVLDELDAPKADSYAPPAGEAAVLVRRATTVKDALMKKAKDVVDPAIE
jgi:hypothetical protein